MYLSLILVIGVYLETAAHSLLYGRLCVD